MRRTSRLVLLLGIFLAALTFVVVLLMSSGGGGFGGAGATQSLPPAQLPTVVANADIPLGTVVTAEMLTTRTIAADLRDSDSLGDVSQAVGKTTRTAIVTGAQVHAGDFQNRAINLSVPPGERAFAVQVSELTGVGNLVDVGDNIDLIISLGGGAFPVTQVLADGTVSVIDGINPLSVKLPLLLQDVQIIGVIEQTAPVEATAAPDGGPAASAPPTISGANKLLILSVTPEQAEVLLFARTTGTLDVILRSPADAGQTVDTEGVILKSLVDTYGILPPELVQVPIPTPIQR